MSDDPDLIVTSVDPSLRRISKHELRRKLVSFLAVSVPPVPLSYVTFEAHIKAQCETYYDAVIKEVYDSLTFQWNRRFARAEKNDDANSKIDPITISSDEEGESEERTPEEPESEKPETKECEHNDLDAPGPSGANDCDVASTSQTNGREEKPPPALTAAELIAVKAEKCTKKYTRYLQETYDLIKNIERTTSCNICRKLKRRIQKFVFSVGQESAIIQQKVARELRAHRVSPKGDLTEAALEKMRMSILIDKLIDISMPDILRDVEKVEHKNDDDDDGNGDDTSIGEHEPKETVTKRKKAIKKPKADLPSADEPQSKAKKISLKIKDSSHPDLQ